MIPSGRLYYYSVNTMFGVLVSSADTDSTLKILGLSSPFVDLLVDILDGLIKIPVTLQVRIHKFINKLAKIMSFTLKTITLERGLVT